mmetsp:Transcript_12108/g.42813  ORF Transcript_12108/g.42813 Transcript_12108/m.42813 type:complete len:189 (-) Transcript_12108:469-1035(-)
MGDVGAFDNGQGVTSIVDSIIYRRLAPEVGAFIRAQPGPRWAALAALVDARLSKGLRWPLPWALLGYQDDFSSISIDAIGAFLDIRIPELFKEYGIKLSEKPAATRPHGPQWLSIGAQFTVTEDRLDVRPRPEVQLKFEDGARSLMDDAFASEETIRSFAGLTEFVRRFVDGASAGSLYRLAAAARHR